MFIEQFRIITCFFGGSDYSSTSVKSNLRTFQTGSIFFHVEWDHVHFLGTLNFLRDKFTFIVRLWHVYWVSECINIFYLPFSYLISCLLISYLSVVNRLFAANVWRRYFLLFNTPNFIICTSVGAFLSAWNLHFGV